MKKRKEQEQTLDLREASDILENVFRECGRRPNSVPMEALASYAVYRKERFELQRGFLATLLVLFFLLPFLFIDSKYTVRVEAAGERKLPVYVIEVDSPLPVFRVTANVRGQDLPVYEAGAKTYTVEPTRNGQMRIDVALINRQNTTDTVEVTGVDNHGPELVSSQVAGGEVRLFVRDDGERGFSYMADAPLDMRMNSEDTLDAKQVENQWPYDELKRVLYDYGEERFAPRIAAAICKRREEKEIETTLELVEIIRCAMPASALREKQHPAKRSFQAIRIAVNDELGSVERVMKKAVPLLNPGGRLAVITFHSLEDRIVKNAMAEAARGCTCPREFPVCVCGKKPQVKLITRKPIVSGEEELERNPRARSAKLRICEKL